MSVTTTRKMVRKDAGAAVQQSTSRTSAQLEKAQEKPRSPKLRETVEADERKVKKKMGSQTKLPQEART